MTVTTTPGPVNTTLDVGQAQYLRKASLVVLQDTTQDFPATLLGNKATANQALDLSQLRFSFQTANQLEAGPDNCSVRVYNPSPTTIQSLLKYQNSRLIVQAGYDPNFGIIFQGDIKQYRTGRLNETDTYIDILAADGDIAFNRATVAATLSKTQNTVDGIVGALNNALKDANANVSISADQTALKSGVLPQAFRGKVLMGLFRQQMRFLADTLVSRWTISNGQVIVVNTDSYVGGPPVILNQATGLLGIPEATQDGIKCRCLINPRIKIGTTVQINNQLINQTLGGVKSFFPGVQIPFDQFSGIAGYANVTHDGLYMVYICEHVGDTRGNDWESRLTLLAIDNTSKNVIASGTS